MSTSVTGAGEPRSGANVESEPESECANNVNNLTCKNIQNKERNEDNNNMDMDQEINILEELKTFQEQFQILKEKIALDEIWKSIINEFILTKFGYDVQKVLNAYSVGFQSSFDSNNSNRSSNSGAAASIPEKGAQESPNFDRFNVSSDSNVLSSRRKVREFKNTDDDNDLATRPSALTQSYSDTGAGAHLRRSLKIPRHSPSLIYTNKSTPTQSNWTCIPTFPLYDAANAVSDINSTIAAGGNVLVKKELHQQDDPDYQDRDYDEGYENRSEVTFNDVENQIRQVVPPGARSKVYECIICNKSLTQKQNARLHVRRVHFGERLKCMGCGRSFYDRRSISNHKATCTKYNEWSKSAGSNVSLVMPKIEIRTGQSESESDTINRRYYLRGKSGVSRGSRSNSNSSSAELLGMPLETETETGMISNNAFNIGSLDSDINNDSQNESNSPSAVIVHDKYITHDGPGPVSGSSKMKKGSRGSSKHHHHHHHKNEILVPPDSVINIKHENQHEGEGATSSVYFQNRSPSRITAQVQYEYTERGYDEVEEDHSDSDVIFNPSKLLVVEMTPGPGSCPLNENEETETSNTEF